MGAGAGSTSFLSIAGDSPNFTTVDAGDQGYLDLNNVNNTLLGKDLFDSLIDEPPGWGDLAPYYYAAHNFAIGTECGLTSPFLAYTYLFGDEILVGGPYYLGGDIIAIGYQALPMAGTGGVTPPEVCLNVMALGYKSCEGLGGTYQHTENMTWAEGYMGIGLFNSD